MTSSASGLVSLTGHEPATYISHALHSPERTYVETNCYTDILIELLHARGYEPLAAMGATARMDFEGDQWTFLKPFPDDLEVLFGVDIHEMQPYRPLPEQASEQISRGRTLIAELDSWYLPDTAATAYRREHVKSSVVVDAIDPESERMNYFHATGLYELSGEDYRGVFRLGREFCPVTCCPPTPSSRASTPGPALEGEELRDASRVTAAHAPRAPPRRPTRSRASATSSSDDLPRLLEGDTEDYHAYAFATVRMAGSAFEVAASHAQWLLGDEADAVVEPLQRIVDGCKVLSFRLARRRPFDPQETLSALAAAWDEGMGRLDDATG